MTRIAIAGAAGRMGRNLIAACGEGADLEVTLAVEMPGHEALGTDSGLLAGLGANGVPLTDALDADAFDTLIDFTHPTATAQQVEFCAAHGKSMVIGTTGCDAALEARLAEAGRQIAIVYAPNTRSTRRRVPR